MSGVSGWLAACKIILESTYVIAGLDPASWVANDDTSCSMKKVASGGFQKPQRKTVQSR